MSTVEVIVPHRSRWDLLARLLDSLERQSVRPALCIVDNASSDETHRELAARPEIRVVRSAENLGFGRAINLGVRSSSAEYVITLNNDMEAEPRFVEHMLKVLESHPRLAVAATQLRPDGRIDTLGVALDQSLCAYDVGHGRAVDDVVRDALTPMGPSGGAAGFRRAVFLELGGYDEEIFAYLEDADLAIRLQAAGIEYRLAKDARVWHRHSSTLGSGSRAKNRLMGWSRGYLLAKYGSRMNRAARVRGLVIDTVVYLGQTIIDRNIGAIEGRVSFARAYTGRVPTPPIIYTDRLTVAEALRRRFRRR